MALGAAPVATGVCARYLPDVLGVALALLAAGCYGGYTVAAKQLLRAYRPIEGVIAASLLGGGLMLAPAFTFHSSAVLSAQGLLLVAWLGLISTALAYALFVQGLRRIPATTAGTLSLAEPLIAVVLAVLILGERFAALTLVGGLLLLAGIGFASLPSLRRPTPVSAPS